MDELEVLRDLMGEYSPSGHEAGAARTFVKIAESLGFVAQVDPVGNAIARIGGGRPRVMFLGHIDTVEGELPVRIEDGRIYGRGACDAKGALAAALVAASHHNGPGEITVVGAVGEECDSRGARHLLPRVRPDFLIVGEPSGWDGVTIGYKGNLSLVMRFEGERSHLSAPTATTVETGLAQIDRLRRFCEQRRGETAFHSLTMKVPAIDTSGAGSREAVDIRVNLRLPPGVRVREILAFIEEDDSVVCDIVDQSEAVEVDPTNEVVRALCAGIREAGSRPTLLRKLGTADLNLAAPAWGCPAAAYGPGDSHLDHTDAERLEIEELRRSVVVLRNALTRLATRGVAFVSASRATIA